MNFAKLLSSFFALVFVVFPACLFAALPPQPAIASAHPLATQAGMTILEKGGNAFDAAIAVSAALAVVEPVGSGLGGGGFWLLHRAEDNLDVMVDGREKAPAAAHRDMYLDPKTGEPNRDLSVNGPLSAGIPGLPAALVHLASHYGQLPLAESLAPAIQYAEQGFAIDQRMVRQLAFREPVMEKFAASRAVFFTDTDEIPKAGSVLKQPDLAKTLTAIAENGRAGFYQGEVARKLVAAVTAAGGIWTLADLDDYRIVEREPVRGEYRGIKVTTAAPPSSGGVVLVEALNILEPFTLGEGAQRKHLVVEAMRRAYHDRALYLGDPDFVEMPLSRLLSQQYATQLRTALEPDRATSSSEFKSVQQKKLEGQDTTHFSILDKAGNRVAATLSINYPYGSGFVVEGTGVLLNDEMDDFSSYPGNPNVYGLVGGGANAIAPGKRMLSSMTPTFLEDHDRVAILGTPGGSRIISMVLLAVLDFADQHSAASWVAVPRYHHQYLPDVISYEPGAISPAEQAILLRYGHTLQPKGREYGNMHAILWNKTEGRVSAASDPRGMGLAIPAIK